MSWLSDIFGGGGVKQALRGGAVVIDLRSAYEYDQGHVPRSLNIPIDRIRANIDRIRGLNKPGDPVLRHRKPLLGSRRYSARCRHHAGHQRW